MPGCLILALKFFSDKKRAFISLSNGMVLLFDTATCLIEMVLLLRNSVNDILKIVDDKYLFCAGIDQHIRIFNIEKQIVNKFSLHPYCTSQMAVHGEFIYTYGYDKTLVKYNFMSNMKICWV